MVKHIVLWRLKEELNLDEKAKDYSMFNAGEYYEYHNVFFVKNAFLNNINYSTFPPVKRMEVLEISSK